MKLLLLVLSGICGALHIDILKNTYQSLYG